MKRPDLFILLSTKLPRNPSVRHAGERGELLFIRGLLWAKENGNTGWVHDFDLPAVAVGLSDVSESVKALVDEGLWIAGDGGWQIPSWQGWYGVDDEAEKREEKRRKDAAERKRRQREREKQVAEKVAMQAADPDWVDEDPTEPWWVNEQSSDADPSSVTPNVTRDVTRDGHAVTQLEKERETEKEPSLREGVQPPLLGVVEPATAAPPRRAKRERKPAKPNPHAVADEIANTWYEANKTTSAQSFISVRQIIRPLVGRGIAPALIAAAMDAATRDGFPISQGSLTTAMNKLSRSSQPQDNVTPLRPSAATRKAGAAFARAARYAAEEGDQLPADPFALEA